MSDPTFIDNTPSSGRMRAVFTRLFAEAKAARGGEDDDQAPAMNAFVILRGLPQPLGGQLSTTPEGGLRLMMQQTNKAGETVSMVEQFFDYSDVVSVALERKIATQAVSSIITRS